MGRSYGLHGEGRAVDWGDARNDPGKLRQLGNWVKNNASIVDEFFYDPLGWYVDKGQIKQGSIGGHGDHAHLGLFKTGTQPWKDYYGNTR